MMRIPPPFVAHSAPRGQTGIALIIVLWITTLLMLVASSFIYAMRTDVPIVANSLARARTSEINADSRPRSRYDRLDGFSQSQARGCEREFDVFTHRQHDRVIE